MEVLTSLSIVGRIKYNTLNWRCSLSVPKKIALAFGIACLTGLLAQTRVILPWTIIPITGQTFAVLLSAIVLGRNWGGLSQAIYAGLGFAGLTWFNGFTAGISPSSGYIVGFVFATFFLGHCIDKIKDRSFVKIFGLMCIANFVFIYGFGLTWIFGWMSLIKGSVPDFYSLFAMGVIPFIAGDIIKIIGAAVVAKAVILKRN